MELFLTIRADPKLLGRIDALLAIAQQISEKEDIIMATLQDLVDDMATETTAIGSVAVLIQGLRDQIAHLPGITPAMQAQIDGLFSSIEANKSSLAAAMAINVPPAPPVTVVPPVV